MSEFEESEGFSSSRNFLKSGELIIEGVRYDNSAAKFWPSFLDDIRNQYQTADRLEMAAPGDGALHAGLLMPEMALARAMESFGDHPDAASAMQGIAAEIEAAGPPAGVRLSVFQDDVLLGDKSLDDFLDAEVFPFLLVWLLEWSCLNEAAWNRHLLRGAFEAEDASRSLIYRIRLQLKNSHLSEGLFQRLLCLQWVTRKPAGEPANR